MKIEAQCTAKNLHSPGMQTVQFQFNKIDDKGNATAAGNAHLTLTHDEAATFEIGKVYQLGLA